MVTYTLPLLILALWLIMELVLWSLINWLRKDFKWLITPADETPTFDKTLIEKYGRLSFDRDLGWLRRAGTSGREDTLEGRKLFSIDGNGCRTNPSFSGKPSRIAVFGDSYAFCRLVDNDETWPYYLSALTGTNVLNFGVGNYGIDQAVLRLEREIENLQVEYIIICFVPETIARVHSYWRHYFEYGNILAFKPRFTLDGGKLVYHPSAISCLNDIPDYKTQIDQIRQLDDFYEGKFKRDLIRFPYLLRIFHRRTLLILFHLIIGRVTGSLDGGFRKAFRVVMRENNRISGELYRNKTSRELLAAIIKRFTNVCEKAGCKPVLVVIPQPVDLEDIPRQRNNYSCFYQTLSGVLPVVDLTERFRKEKNIKSLYIEGELGPHTSPKGNRIIADALMSNILGDHMQIGKMKE